jgi:hypothetical protein
MGAAAVLRGIDCRARILIPQPTEWQHIGNRIDTAFVCAPADFVKGCELVITTASGWLQRLVRP